MRMIEKISLLMSTPKKIRNIALVAHIDHGKTTLSDSLLVASGILAPLSAGDARALDFLPEEQRRGITMKTANISLILPHKETDYLVNLIDSPGHVDFSGKVARALRIVDGAIVIIDAVEQIMAQTETVIRQCITEGVKPILFINKVDRLINELKLTPKQIAERLEIIYNNFNALVERYSSQTTVPKWRSTTKDGSVVFGSALHRWAISLPIIKESKITFEEIINYYLQGKQDELPALLPIDKPLIDMIITHLPNPIEAQKYRIKHIWKGDLETLEGKAMTNCLATDAPLVFGSTKIMSDTHAGSLLLGRVFSGTLEEKANVLFVNTNVKGKVRNIYVFMGQDKKRIQTVPVGNMVAISGLENVNPGETLVSQNKSDMVPFEQIKYLATPVVTVAVEPDMLRDLPELRRVLDRFDLEDPNLISTVDEKSGEILLMGLGELHLETVIHDVSKEVACTASDPIVVIAERIDEEGSIIEKKLFGTTVTLLVEPVEKELTQDQESESTPYYQEKFRQYNNEIIVESALVSRLSKESLENILIGVKDALAAGPISQKPVYGIRVVVSKFVTEAIEKYEHTVPLLRNTVWDALRKSGITTQEPIYKIQVTAPAKYLGKVSSVINKRRGTIIDVRSDNELLIITGELPVAESFKIDLDLRSDTEGRAFWQMSFERYKSLPQNILEEFK
ncbi:MAG: GTP-binding protein [Candidatus Heimdallarchaeota archaeon]